MNNRTLILLLLAGAVVYFVFNKEKTAADGGGTDLRNAPPSTYVNRTPTPYTQQQSGAPSGTSSTLADANTVADLAGKFASVVDKAIGWFQTNEDGKA